jgi:hypothetical protein
MTTAVTQGWIDAVQGDLARRRIPHDRPSLLPTINWPADLGRLGHTELVRLAAEIRSCLLTTVNATGGHLGPNLGAVELTLALHDVFDSPHSRIIWNTGHQAYVHKIVTVRRDGFDRLRQRGVFGDSRQTGKPEGEDLRKGEHTVLVAPAPRMPRPPSGPKWPSGSATPGPTSTAPRSCGKSSWRPARWTRVELMIADRANEALSQLAAIRLDENVAAALGDLAVAATHRQS